MFHTVQSVRPLPDFHLHILFRNGEKKVYDTNPLIKTHETFQSFTLTHGLFEQVKVDKGGYGIYWNENIDIGCNELYVNGKEVIK